jgi:hypothetical protein
MMVRRLVTAALVLGLMGCKDAPPTAKPEDKADAGAQAPVMDKNIANAVASAAASTNPAGGGEGPPANGVFADGAADRAVPPGQAPQVVVAQKGSDPKIKLQPLYPLAEPLAFDVTVLRVEGRTVMPVTFGVVASPVGAEPAPDPKAPPTAPKEAPAPAQSAEPKEAPPEAAPLTAPQPVLFTVTSVRPAAQKEAPIGEDELKQLQTLVGARILAELSPAGLLGKETFELPPTGAKSMGHAVRALVESLGFLFHGVPAEPIGVGGQWIVGDRVAFAGMNVVRYRATTLESAKGDELVMSVDVRLYAVDKGEAPIRFGEEAVALAFQAQGNMKTVHIPGMLVPVTAQLEMALAMQIAQSADADMAQVYQMKAVAVLAPPGADEEDGDDGAPKKDPKKKTP